MFNNVQLRNALSVARNSMISSESPSPEPLLKKKKASSHTEGKRILKCSGGLKCLELQGLGVSMCTLERNFRKSSESVSGVFPPFFRNFFQTVPVVLGVHRSLQKTADIRRFTPSLGNSIMWGGEETAIFLQKIAGNRRLQCVTLSPSL